MRRPRAIHFFSPRKGCDVTKIWLEHRDLHGSLAKEFRELRALEQLDLRDNNVTGDLHDLKENTALTHLRLQNTRISGDLQSLAKSTALTHLRLQNTRISGDLKSLSKATGLEGLYLQGTQVSGDLVALSNAKDLLSLELSETKVYGDLVALSNAKDLLHLDLSATKVVGDLAALSNAKKLTYLHLAETKISGDVAALKNAKDLWRLHLTETKVYGDLASLAHLTEVATLQLSSTKVSGDVSVILQWKKIQHLGLSGSEVTSHPTEKWKNCCKNLETLDLAQTKVPIMDEFLANFESSKRRKRWFCPFPALTSFNITGTPLNTTVSKLLKPFVACTKLQAFGAATCSLKGEFHPIGFLQIALQLLDLSSNNVTKVEAIPGNCRAVMFRENPSISFAEDVVKKATQQFVSVDLRNATFADPRDTKVHT